MRSMSVSCMSKCSVPGNGTLSVSRYPCPMRVCPRLKSESGNAQILNLSSLNEFSVSIASRDHKVGFERDIRRSDDVETSPNTLGIPTLGKEDP